MTPAILLALLAIQAQEPAPAVPMFEGLGTHTWRITARASQAYFDQGFRLTYAFNHADAIRSFREAARRDTTCAMCLWGEALAWGPNINGAMDSVGGAGAYAAVRRAVALAPHGSPMEQGLIMALAERYDANPVAARGPLDSAYARAMVDVARRYPADDDAQVLAADALMNMSPWDYYLPGGAPRPHIATALRLLETVLARSPNHVGACHLYIHAVEARAPELAVPCADRLPSLMPGAGHIVHMPAHVYIRVGRYEDAIAINAHAAHADEAVIPDLAPDGAYRLAYYPHNHHFIWFAATMAGHEQTALDAAVATARASNQEMMRTSGLGALQHYIVTPLFAQVRFERWDEVLAAPAFDSDLPYPNGIRHYARAVALARTGRPDEATAELALLSQAARDPGLEGMTIWGFNASRAVLEVAVHAAAGEIALAKGDLAGALTHFEAGVALEDALTYDEPPTWHLPVRHQLAAALLTAGRREEAMRAYEQDLERHPNNVWSLRGVERVRSEK